MYEIDYKILADAIDFYQRRGFEYVEVPWTCRGESLNLTKPKDHIGFEIESDEFLLGSAEQGFIQLLDDKKISNGSYCACTPCFRSEPDGYDYLRRKWFMKVELISIQQYTYKEICQIAKTFFERYTKVEIVKTQEGLDIYKGSNFELGSYGPRYTRTGIGYHYGTGVALPRLTQSIPMKKGYHMAIIPKEPYGSREKLREEVEEYIDADNQECTIMKSVELSDLYGALEVEAMKLGLSMEDLSKMANLTKRSFESGERS